MSRIRLLKGVAIVAAVFLAGCAVSWASDQAPRPDAVADDQTRPTILIFAKKDAGGPPAIHVPRPIEIKPVGQPVGATGLWGNFSNAFAAPAGGQGSSQTTQIEASLESVAQKLR